MTRTEGTGSTVRAAVVQAASVGFDRERTLQKLEDLAADAARGGASLAVFPEAFVGGYPRGVTFGTVVGSRTTEGREVFRRYWGGGVDVPGPAVSRLERVARSCGLHLVVGVVEREGGTLYCTVLFLSPTTGLMGKHRKVMPTAAERLVWGFGDGSTLPVLDTPVGRLGAVICWENYMPLLRMAMYARGVQVYCAPTADSRETWLPTVRHIALEGRCFVLSSCQYARRRDLPGDVDNALATAPEDVLMAGGSCIVDPLGQVLVGPERSGETILCADLDLAEIPRAKFDLDVAGHYARPDVFQLVVNEEPRPPVSWRTGGSR